MSSRPTSDHLAGLAPACAVKVTSGWAAPQARGLLNSTTEYCVYDWTAWNLLAPHWAKLVGAIPGTSVFLSEPWMTSWMETFGAQLKPSIVAVERAGEIVGACVLSTVTSRIMRMPVRCVALNATGEAAEDTTFAEYNDLLCHEGLEGAVAEAVRRVASAWKWDEVLLPGFRPGPAYGALKSAFEGLELREERRRSYYVDLAAIRGAGVAYEAVLTGSSRKHLRQNLRYHASTGELRAEVAADAKHAAFMFEELAEFGRRRWSRNGHPSVFESERFMEFHRRLIARCFSRGGVQLLRVSAGNRPVGVIYNLIHHNRVYFYQCGYNYTEDKRLSPGTVTLSMAIQHCLDAGFDEYDFLSGHANYKRSLGTGGRDLVWSALRAPRLKLTVLDRLQDLRDRFRGESEA